ncbi:hypothetical protein GW17_00054794 [Ensete ventricosum]|nr:hypothetical protein GW17_00054794 [Ensete ventricosum]
MRELCEVDGRAGRGKYFIVWISDLPGPEAEGSLKGLHFSVALINRVNDVGRVVCMLTEKVSTLRVEIRELKSGMGPEAVVDAEKRAVNLELRYRITLERLLVKYPYLSIEEDPLLTDPKMPPHPIAPSSTAALPILPTTTMHRHPTIAPANAHCNFRHCITIPPSSLSATPSFAQPLPSVGFSNLLPPIAMPPVAPSSATVASSSVVASPTFRCPLLPQSTAVVVGCYAVVVRRCFPQLLTTGPQRHHGTDWTSLLPSSFSPF